MVTTKLIYRSHSLSMSHFLAFATKSKPLCRRYVGLAPGKRNNPKVVCLNATEGSD